MRNVGISISGGSSKGAFAVGVLHQLRRRWNVTFNMVAGTSTGALVAPFAVTEEYSKVQELYSTLSTEDFLMMRRPRDIWRKGSVFDVDGLWRVMQDAYTHDRVDTVVHADKFMFITTVALHSGRVTHFFTGPRDAVTDGDADLVRIHNRDDLLEAVFASALQPVLMPSVPIDGDQYVDGGVRETAPIKILIDNGVDDLISVVLTAENEGPDDDSFDNLLAILKRTISLFTQEVVLNDIRIAQTYNQAVQYLTAVRAGLKARMPDKAAEIDAVFDDPALVNPVAAARVITLHLIRPNAKLLADSLHFSEDDMRRMIRLGKSRVDQLFPPAGAGPFPPAVPDPGPIV